MRVAMEVSVHQRWLLCARRLCCVGVAGLALAAQAQQLVNGGFESPGGLGAVRVIVGADTPQSIAPWAVSGPGTQVYQSSGTDNLTAAEGRFWVSFGHSNTTGGRLQQVVATPVGVEYTVRYSVTPQQGVGSGQSMAVRAVDVASGAVLAEATTAISATRIAWVDGTPLVFTSRGQETRIEFVDTSDVNSPGAVAGNWALDAVRLESRAPEPVRQATFGGSATGPIQRMTLSVNLSAANADVGKPTQVFVVILLRNGVALLKTANGFAVAGAAPYPAAQSWTPTSAPLNLDLVRDADLRGGEGAQIFVGYGSDLLEMIALGRYRMVVQIP